MDDIFIRIAKIIAGQSKCYRSKVGAIIVKNNQILGFGYNKIPIGMKECRDIGYCYREKNNIVSGTSLEKCRSVGSHAECNALLSASNHKYDIAGSTIYVVGHNFVCDQCKALLLNAGITRVVLSKPDDSIKYFSPILDWKRHGVD